MPIGKITPFHVCLAGLVALFSASMITIDTRAETITEADGPARRVAPEPVVRATRLNGLEITLDGRLGEAAWTQAEAVRDFTQDDPDRGAVPSESTMFMVVYDDDAIYFGVGCYENEIANIASTLCRRDKIEDSDFISVYIDPYHDRTTGYNFRVNPRGVVADAYIFNDGERDQNWDAVWEAETSIDEYGWTAEIRIPFSSIRYRSAESMTWGFQVYRYLHGRGEFDAWVSWDREARGFVSRFGDLDGIEGIRPPRQLEIVPYIVVRATDPTDGHQWDHFANLGADIKYGVTADLTLNATIQPDFGQVEADPAVLNLSPFETFYEEKRPFFVEGSRFFAHPRFNVFYSRRIGTGDKNARIRFAGKLTGKTSGGISIAGLFASTDIAQVGKAHNIFKGGNDRTYYAVARVGKESADGNHRIHIMQTATLTADDSHWVGNYLVENRDAYTTGLDLAMNFKDRMFTVQGSFVGSHIVPSPVVGDPSARGDPTFGTGGTVDIAKGGGKLRGSTGIRWVSNKLDLNDLGYLRSNDEYDTYLWLGFEYDADGENDAFINKGNLNFNYYQSWLYAGRSVSEPDAPDQLLWSYGPGHRQGQGWNINGWTRTRHFWSAYYLFWHDVEGTSKYLTRTFDDVRGPLMTTPAAYGGRIAINSDTRTPYSINAEIDLGISVVGDALGSYELGVRWNQSERWNHRLTFTYQKYGQDAQWLDNFANPGGGIGDVSYVFGELDQRTWDLTLRSSFLFDRNKSLELYVQPFLTTGVYENVKELVRPDSYDLRPYRDVNFDISDRDFRFGSVNLNLVFRWEYQAGSTVYLVWTHKREEYTERRYVTYPGLYEGGFDTGPWFDSKPENTLLFKLSYWFSL